jgi:hypothetical protein
MMTIVSECNEGQDKHSHSEFPELPDVDAVLDQIFEAEVRITSPEDFGEQDIEELEAPSLLRFAELYFSCLKMRVQSDIRKFPVASGEGSWRSIPKENDETSDARQRRIERMHDEAIEEAVEEAKLLVEQSVSNVRDRVRKILEIRKKHLILQAKEQIKLRN